MPHADPLDNEDAVANGRDGRSRPATQDLRRRLQQIKPYIGVVLYVVFVAVIIAVLMLRGHLASGIAVAATVLVMVALQRLGVDRVQGELGGLLPYVPMLAAGGTLLLLDPSGGGTTVFYAATATVIPTSLIAIAVSGRLLAGRLRHGVDLFRAGLGLYFIAYGEFVSLRALYRGVGTSSDVTAAAAGVVAAFATVLVAALVWDLAPTTQTADADRFSAIPADK